MQQHVDVELRPALAASTSAKHPFVLGGVQLGRGGGSSAASGGHLERKSPSGDGFAHSDFDGRGRSDSLTSGGQLLSVSTATGHGGRGRLVEPLRLDPLDTGNARHSHEAGGAGGLPPARTPAYSGASSIAPVTPIMGMASGTTPVQEGAFDFDGTGLSAAGSMHGHKGGGRLSPLERPALQAHGMAAAGGGDTGPLGRNRGAGRPPRSELVIRSPTNRLAAGASARGST